MLNRDAILKAQDLKREIVDVPEWGGEVYVRGFTALEKEEVEIRSMSMVDVATGQIRDARQLAGLKAWIVARCVVDSDGVRIFLDADMDGLQGKNAEVIARLADTAGRLSALGADVEQAEKNFVSRQNGNFGTSSH